MGWILALSGAMFLLGGGLLLTSRRNRAYILVEHLASLAERNLPLASGLRPIGSDLGGSYRRRMARVASLVEDGQSLGDAFQNCGALFPPQLSSAVVIGERSGNLSGFLRSMRDSFRSQLEFRHQFLMPLLYPVIVSLAVCLVIHFVHLFIVPKLDRMAEEMGMPGPYDSAAYAVTVFASQALSLAFVGIFAGVLFGTTPVRRCIERYAMVRTLWHRLALSLPVARTAIRDAAYRHWAFTVGTYLGAGATLPEALRAAAAYDGNDVMKDRFGQVSRAVEEGSALSEAVSRSDFPRDMVWHIMTGEAGGLLGRHLIQAADLYAARAQMTAQKWAPILAPVFLLINGGLVLAISLVLIGSLTGLLQGGLLW